MSYEPGTNIYSDLLFALILFILYVISFSFTFYALPRIFKKDKERQDNCEKWVIKLLIKLAIFVIPMATFIGMPIIIHALSLFFLLFYLVLSLVEYTDTNFITYILFILFTSSYIYFIPKRINPFIDKILIEPIKFFSDYDLLPTLPALSDEEAKRRYEFRLEDTLRGIKMFKYMFHFITVPVVILSIINFIVTIL